MKSRDPLFTSIIDTYVDAGRSLSNQEMYAKALKRSGMSPDILKEKNPVGKSGQKHNLVARKMRFMQQSLKHMGVLESVKGKRGVWKLTEIAGQKLRRITPKYSVIAFSTDLGVAIWSDNKVLTNLDEPIHLVISSPPYPLRRPRAYGNPDQHEYIDFICKTLEPIIHHLVPGGSISLNLSNEIFHKGMPSRSTYIERLVIALEDRLGLCLMDRLIWEVPNKLKNPKKWVSDERIHLAPGYELVYWFSNDPLKVRSSNLNVLMEHTERHKKLAASGGEKRDTSYGDGFNSVRKGSFSELTPGAIPNNVFTMRHNCPEKNEYRRRAAHLNLPLHGASYPVRFATFLIEFLSRQGDMVVDPFGGKITSGYAAQLCGRRWICADNILEYVRGGAEMFRNMPDFWLNPALDIELRKNR